jgi:DNA-directed RNA polymerase subunit RPC12/RpoP
VTVLTEFRTYGCTNCGAPYPVVQPDDVHIINIPNPCPKGDSIEMAAECPKCNFRHTLHWDKKHDDNEDRFRRMANVSP